MSIRTVLWISLPIAGSAAYAIWLHRSITRSIRVTFTKETSLSSNDLSLPQDVLEDPANFEVWHEHAEKTVPVSTLPLDDSATRLTKYLRHNMTAWSRSWPAWIIWFLVKSPTDRKMFSAEYLQSLDYRLGDRVCAVYRVVKREPSRAELIYDVPESYKGPMVKVLLASSIEEREKEKEFAFVNDVYMWRRKNESAVPFETAAGRFMHTMIVGNLMNGGVSKLMEEARGKK